MFFKLLHAKPCRIIWKFHQKVNIWSQFFWSNSFFSEIFFFDLQSPDTVFGWKNVFFKFLAEIRFRMPIKSHQKAKFSTQDMQIPYHLHPALSYSLHIHVTEPKGGGQDHGPQGAPQRDNWECFFLKQALGWRVLYISSKNPVCALPDPKSVAGDSLAPRAPTMLLLWPCPETPLFRLLLKAECRWYGICTFWVENLFFEVIL